MTWNERHHEDGTVYFADLNTSHLLIHDRGIATEGDRYSWSLVRGDGAEPHCLIKGESNSLFSAKEDALLYAQRQGLLIEQDSVYLPDGIHRSVGSSSENHLSAEGLLVTPPSSHEKASPFLIGEGPDVRFEQDALLSAVHSTGTGVDSLIRDIDPPKSLGVKEHAALAGVATASALSAVGGVAASVAKSAGGVAMQVVSTAAREDELAGRMDEGREVIMGAVAKEVSKGRSKKHGSNLDFLMQAESQLLADEPSPSQVGVREKSEPVDARQLAEKLRKEKALSEKDLGLLEADELESPSEGQGKKKEKKPVTKRERDLQAKRKKLKYAKLDAGNTPFLINPSKKMKDSLGSGVGVAKNMTVSSVTKVISKENEDVATLLSMTGAGKKAVGRVKSAARLPVKIAHGVRHAVNLIKTVWHAVVHAVSAIAAAGWPVVLLLLGVLLVVVVVVVGSLVIINENQETSEVAALVAELDGQLEDEIRSYGTTVSSLSSIPIYYVDARGTYNTFDENDEDQTSTST